MEGWPTQWSQSPPRPATDPWPRLRLRTDQREEPWLRPAVRPFLGTVPTQQVGDGDVAEPLCDIGPMPWGDGTVDAADLEVLMRYWQQEILPPELVAYWKLDETEGSIAYDSVGEYDGTLYGEPLWQPEDGKVGGALQLDGVDDRLITPFILNPADGQFSVFAWVKGGRPYTPRLIKLPETGRLKH